jgi:hypothetical protein
MRGLRLVPAARGRVLHEHKVQASKPKRGNWKVIQVERKRKRKKKTASGRSDRTGGKNRRRIEDVRIQARGWARDNGRQRRQAREKEERVQDRQGREPGIPKASASPTARARKPTKRIWSNCLLWRASTRGSSMIRAGPKMGSGLYVGGVLDRR